MKLTRKIETKHLTFVLTLTLLNACGPNNQETSKPDIVGGRTVQPGESGPQNVSTVGLSGCTGTIVAKDLILTAAHCYQNAVSGGYVVFGTSFQNRNRRIVEIAGALVNRNYTGPGNDVAMLRLASPIPEGYQPVKLHGPDLPLFQGDRVRQAGYGSDNSPNSFGVLRTVDSVLQSRSRDGALFVRNGRTAACSGDSGGPLYWQSNGEWYTIGITSTAIMDNFRRCTGGNFYAPVRENLSLITQMAQDLTGRNEPFAQVDQPTPSPAEPEEPAVPDNNDKGNGDDNDQDDPQADPPRFQVLTDLSAITGGFTAQVRNVTPYTVNNCEFTLTLTRRNFMFATEYELTTMIETSAPDQEHKLEFADYAQQLSTLLGPVEDYNIKKTCD